MGAWAHSAPSLTPGPTISFAFNLGKIPDQGEDSDPICREGPDLGLVAVFDGMGGAGGTVYETSDGRRTGAYIASRVARDVVERRMLDLLEPDWNLNGKAAALDLERSVQSALQERLEELKAPPSGLRSRLLRALPTTMALVALQRTQPGGPNWTAHVLWAGDSRAYVLEPGGVRQLSTDDLRDPGDALANLRRDSVVSNAMSADTDFHINYRRVKLEAPFLVMGATDGCFGYVPTPMHFEDLVLRHLAAARNVDAWSAGLQEEISAITGDDAAMAVLGIGADFTEFKDLFAPRLDELAQDVIAPLDELRGAITRAEQELEALRSRQVSEMGSMWHRYKDGYERYLHPEPVLDEEEPPAEEAAEDPEERLTSPTNRPRPPPVSRSSTRSRRSQPVGGVVVRAGDVLNGYTILEDFKVVGAGLSKWTFAERGGRQFFIKEFLSPTYPDENAPGSEKTKAKKRARCAVFEAHHRGVQRALAPLSAYGGNLIVTLDFFRWGAKYYKVTEKVDAAGLSAADVRRLGLRTQLVLMKTVSHSLKILHDLKIVHSDLKPSNVLIKQTELGYTTKLIDFDSSYIAGRPPPPEEIVGTINYYSPELLGYIQEAGVTPAELGIGLRRLRAGPDLHRVPDRGTTAVRRRALPRAGRRGPQRRAAAHPSGRNPRRAR